VNLNQKLGLMQTGDVEIPSGKVANDETLLAVLDVIDRNAMITQRSVARELNIALGLANAYLKRCARKGLIKVSAVPARRYAYYLTPQGFAEKSRLTANYLADSFSFFRQARSQCRDAFATAAARGQRRLLLVGEGELAEIASFVVRDHGVEIVAVIATTGDEATLRKTIEPLGRIDGVVLTALSGAHEAYRAVIAVFGAERVHAPALLRLRAQNSISEEHAS
jgi:DNA-binding MarR family transcriptional regulator